MVETDRARLRLALSIVSGRRRRVGFNQLRIEDYQTLGYDVYKFGAYGEPDASAIEQTAEDIVFQAIADAGAIE